MIKRPDFQNFWYRHKFANKRSCYDLSQLDSSPGTVPDSHHSSLEHPTESDNSAGMNDFGCVNNSSLILLYES